MKNKLIIAVLLFIGIVSNIFAQKIDFSSYLASGGRVHTSTPSVVDKNGNIFVAGGTREGLKVTDDAFQKKYNGHTKDDVDRRRRIFNEIVTKRRNNLLNLYWRF